MNIDTAAKVSGLTSEMANSAKFWLADQLMADEHAKLGQGGHTNTQVPLRRVFIDLPVSVRENPDARIGFLKQLIKAPALDLTDAGIFEFGARNARAHDVDSYKLIKQARARAREAIGWGAVLLVGGPGQGKSTLGQLACQLHRAQLLQPYRAALSMSQGEVVRTLIDPINSKAEKSEAFLPPQPLLPIHISLPKLMAWASKTTPDQDPSTPILLRYIEQLPSATRLTFSAKIIRSLAKQLGCLLVLDGFDEVGAVKDRDFIVTAANELLVEFRSLGAKVQVLITTRPQGYAGEMARIGLRMQEQTLQPLQRPEALEYAEKLIQAKVESADQRRVMLDRVREAADEPATQRLLSTPLQVTILTALVQQLGRAPRERWRLFEQYFSYTYNREIERDTYASSLLSQHRAHVEKIHARIALILQVESESEGAAAGISKHRLEEVISTVLAEDEVQPDKLNDLVKEISKAAEERLVFLVEPEPGKFGFEIRSLQEFMAAHALTSGRDISVEHRIRQIARASMFRNTTLFCASRFFSDGSPLRDSFSEICEELDGSQADSAERLSRAGALLALETLEEGAVLTQPKRARRLMEKASELLILPPAAEHIRLSQVANQDIAGILEERIRQHFSTERPARKLNVSAVWLCLLESISRDATWALDLGESFKGELPFDGAFMEVASSCGLPIGGWLARHLETLPATFATKFFALRWRMLQEAKPTWIFYLSQVLGLDVLNWRRRHVVNFNTIESSAAAMQEPSYALPEQWQSLYAIATHEKAPSAASLASALRSLADPECHIDVDFLIQRTSWPLASALWYCDEKPKYCALADELSENKCGDVKIWLEWEKVWIDNEFDPIVAIESSRAHPFDPIFRERAPLLLSFPVWLYLQGRIQALSRRVYDVASRLFDASTRHRERVLLAQACLSSLRALPARTPRSHFRPNEWISLVPDAVLYLTSKPRVMKRNEWISALDQCHASLESPWMASIEQINVGLAESEFHPALLRVLLSLFTFYSLHFSTREHVPLAGIEEVGNTFFNLDLWKTDDAAGADAALVVLASGVSPPHFDEELLQRAFREAEQNPDYWSTIAGVLALTRLDGARALALTCSALERVVANPQASSILVRSIKAELQKRVSDLSVPSVWDRLALPLPRPRGMPAGQNPSYQESEVVTLKSIHLTHVAGIAALRADFSIPTDAGQWIVILGPNGSGKSTILKSIALSLRNVRDPAIWPKGTFVDNWVRISGNGDKTATEATISLELANGQKLETIIRGSSPGLTINQTPELKQATLVPIYAYGCRRGSALSGGSRAVNINDDDGPEIATLFDSDASLIHAETWLVSLDGDAQKSQSSRTILESVVAALKSLLNATNISVRDQRVWVSLANEPDLPIGALSDGYLTSAGWFLDLISRWLRVATQTNLELDSDFLAKMTGLVLIDEIDLHLHPRWQVDVIERTRKLLPKMSFVVTTHNPLTLIGAAADEIWVLGKSDGQVVIDRGVESPVLLTGGQLYRRYFGIEDVYPSEVARDVERFGFLSGQNSLTSGERVELRELRHALTAAGYVSEEVLASMGSSEPLS